MTDLADLLHRHEDRLESLAEHGAIDPKDLDLFRYCSDPQDAFEYLKSQLLPHLIDTE